jgi:hypothetical protein
MDNGVIHGDWGDTWTMRRYMDNGMIHGMIHGQWDDTWTMG